MTTRTNAPLPTAAGSLSGKVVLVTGGSRALRRTLVSRFAGAGAMVACCSRRYDDLRVLENDCRQQGFNVVAMPCDVRVESAVVRTIHRVFERFGRIDVVVNA